MIVSARCSFRWSRRFSVSSCLTRGSTGRGVGPRRRPRISRRAPAARCRRQFVSSDEYRPSRRNSAPTSPGFLQASASVRMRSRYSAEKRRRWTLADTSGSGSAARDVVIESAARLIRLLAFLAEQEHPSVTTAPGLHRELERAVLAGTVLSPLSEYAAGRGTKDAARAALRGLRKRGRRGRV